MHGEVQTNQIQKKVKSMDICTYAPAVHTNGINCIIFRKKRIPFVKNFKSCFRKRQLSMGTDNLTTQNLLELAYFFVFLISVCFVILLPANH
ncbi:uncharacterized protein LOC122576843 isoform X2 [Bombus pyrosoma]|uniref:uncharacterized protein LOC122576843 isoform X2 n=1 Tax=Bombus pyrosoma TaxID=396416 RepID=UPI001CB8F357|nr:uncharacterized protein LOC122576843 isoform X2 [Bombus pyrosoma]